MSKLPPVRRMIIDIKPVTLITLIFVGLVAYWLWQVQGIILLVLTSVVIASFIESATIGLRRFKIPRVLAVIIVYVLTFAAFAAVLYLFIPIFLDELTGILDLLPEDSTISSFVEGIQGNAVAEFTNGSDPVEAIGSFQERYLSGGGFLRGASVAVGGIVNFVLILVISFYLSVQEKGVEDFLRAVTPVRHERRIIGLWHRTQKKIGLWFQGQLLVAAIEMVLTYLGLLLIGVPYALMLSLIAGLFALIPFGIFLATVPALVIGYLAGGLPMMLFVLGLYVIIQQFENYLFQPVIIKRVTGVPSIIVLLSLIVAVNLFGFLGLFLAIPAAVVILEIIHDEEERKKAQMNEENDDG